MPQRHRGDAIKVGGGHYLLAFKCRQRPRCTQERKLPAQPIGPDGHAEWRAVASDVSAVEVSITTTGAWQLYDPTFTSVANGKGSAVASLPAGSGLGYLTLFGDPGQSITIAVQ